MRPFTRKIQHKILFPVLVILTSMLGVTVVYIAEQTKQELLDNARTDALSSAELVAATVWRTADTDALARDARTIQAFVLALQKNKQNLLRLSVLDASLDVVSSTDDDLLFERLGGADFSRALNNQHTIRTSEKADSDPAVDVYFPVSAGPGPDRVVRGVVHLRMSLAKQFADLQRFRRSATVAGALILLALSMAIILISRSITRPIQQLYQGMGRVNDGDLDVEVEVVSRDEVGYLTSTFNDMLGRLRRMIDSSRRFVPAQFLQSLGRHDITDVDLGDAILRDMTVMFTDIRDFTPMSERLSAQDNLRLLNRLLQRTLPAIEENDGFVDKYMGDATMALFDSPEQALRAGVQLHQAVQAFNEEQRQSGGETIGVGVGINHGELILGTVGSTSRIDTTVIGATVNVAARLEKLTKEFDVPIILPRIVWDGLARDVQDEFATRNLGAVPVRGVTGELELIGVLLPT